MLLLGHNFFSIFSAEPVFEPTIFRIEVNCSTTVLMPLANIVKRLKFQFSDSKRLKNTLNVHMKDWSCQGSLIKGGWFSTVDLLFPLTSLAY